MARLQFPHTSNNPQINNTFWFYREIMPYAEDCKIVESEDVREKFKEKVRSLYLKYSKD